MFCLWRVEVLPKYNKLFLILVPEISQKSSTTLPVTMLADRNTISRSWKHKKLIIAQKIKHLDLTIHWVRGLQNALLYWVSDLPSCATTVVPAAISNTAGLITMLATLNKVNFDQLQPAYTTAGHIHVQMHTSRWSLQLNGLCICCCRLWNPAWHLHTYMPVYLLAVLAWEVMLSPPSVRLSICFQSNFWTKWLWPFACVWVITIALLWLKVKVRDQGQTPNPNPNPNVVSLTSILNPGQFSSCLCF